MYATYDIYLQSATGHRLALIDSNTLLSMQWARSIYGEGGVDIVTANSYPFSYIQQDGRLEVYRTIHLDTGGTITSLLTDTVWLITKYAQEIKSGSLPLYHIMAEPMVSILKRRIVANASDASQASKTATGDNMMKAIVREQFGSSVTDGTRDISAYLAIDADATLGVSMTKAFARRNVFTVLREISDSQAQSGTRIYFDITYDVPTLMATFHTYAGQRGTDHSSTGVIPVTFSYQRDNMQDPSLTYDFTNEENYIYALGQGTGSARVSVEAGDSMRVGASVFNRRELAYDQRQYSTTAGLGDEANSALWSGRPTRNIAGTLLSTNDTAFGIQWGFGDLVSAEFGSIQQNCIVESVTGTLSSGAEAISATARGIN